MSMDRMRWYAVRCCCTPKKVFGFIRLPDRVPVAYEVLDRAGVRQRIEIQDVCRSTVVHRVGDVAEINGAAERAVYSDDRPIEFWRTIPGFVEAQGEVEP